MVGVDGAKLLHRSLCLSARLLGPRELRRVPTFFHFVYFSRGTLPQKRNGKRALLGDLLSVCLSVGRSVCLSTCVHVYKSTDTCLYMYRRTQSSVNMHKVELTI